MKNVAKKPEVSFFTQTKNNLTILADSFIQWLNEIFRFIFILFKPANLIGIGITFYLIFNSQKQIGSIRLLLDIISSFSGGITGGLITHYIIQYFSNTSLIKKSSGAIRNLQLIKYKVQNVSDRISTLSTSNNSRDFEEIDNLVQNIHKDILNSIGDWSDVNPNANAFTDYYELVTQNQKALKELKREKDELVKQKENLDMNKTVEINRLTKEIENRDNKITKLNDQLLKLNVNNIGIISGSQASGYNPYLVSPSSSVSPLVSISGLKNSNRCNNCGMIYEPSGYLDSGYCSNCRGY